VRARAGLGLVPHWGSVDLAQGTLALRRVGMSI